MWDCTNNVLRAHASAVREFRSIVPNGKIGMNLAVQWSEPLSDSEEDRVRAWQAAFTAGCNHMSCPELTCVRLSGAGCCTTTHGCATD